MMTSEQRGWYIQLLCEAWESEIQATLPNDLKILWILAGAASEQVFNTCSSPVLSMFEKRGEHLIHHRLAEEKAKQEELSELRKKAGRESGKARRQLLKDKHLARLNTCSTHAEQTPNTPSEQNTNTPSTIASASSIANSYKENHVPSGAEKALKPLGKPRSTISPKAWDFMKLWKSRHLEFFGVPFKEDGDFDGMAAESLVSLDGYSMDGLMEVAEKAWKNPEGFWSKFASSISGFSKKFNEIRKEVGSLKVKPKINADGSEQSLYDSFGNPK